MLKRNLNFRVARFSAYSDDHRSKLVTCQFLCRKCLVGSVVPVWRPGIDRWRMGEVATYDEQSGQHHVMFLDDTEAWVVVEQSPFDEYLAFYRGRVHQNPSRRDVEGEPEPYPLSSSAQQDAKPSESADKENERLMQVQ